MRSGLNKEKYLLSIDCGTQSIRALVFTAGGELVAKTQVPLNSYFSDHSGWVEHHPHQFWDSLCRVCQQLWSLKTVSPEQIAGVALTTQRATMICVDEKGEPLRPAIIWMDQRKATQLPKISPWWKLAFQLAGVDSTVKGFMRDAEINWLKQHQASLFDNTHQYLFLSGYLNFRLTGNYFDSVGSQVGYVPFDYKKHRWESKLSWKWQACPVKPEQLPQLKHVGEQLGQVTQQAAQQTGLPQGLPVIAAAADKACETIGCGAISKHQGQISYGTTATFNVITEKYLEPIRHLPPYPAAIPHHYTCEYQIYRGYWMVSWFKEQFAHKEQQEAEKQGVSAEQLLDQLASQIDPGSNGLILQPYWSPGVKIPGPEARGSIIGFTDEHTRGHLYRAMLEGITFGLFQGKESIESRSKNKVSELFVSGGGAQSQTALQITADVFNLPVKCPSTFETSGLGAAINTAVGLGIHSNYQDAVDAMCHTDKVIEPIEKNVSLYSDIYQHIFKKMYGKLKPLYKHLERIEH